jgi:hypothetical protein
LHYDGICRNNWIICIKIIPSWEADLTVAQLVKKMQVFVEHERSLPNKSILSHLSPLYINIPYFI